MKKKSLGVAGLQSCQEGLKIFRGRGLKMQVLPSDRVFKAELLRMKTITSPISGFVTDKYLSAGEYVESQPIVKVVEINPLNVEVTALIDMLGKIKKGDRAQVYLEGPVKGPLRAVVDIVDNVIDPASGTFGIRLKLPNSDHSIPSGVKCRVDWDS